ncbi:MAG: hypothetical protein AB7G28_08875 [Pirellulales bacterium]
MEIAIGDGRYRKSAYVPPERGALYSIRDKSKGERVIRVVEVSADGVRIEVEAVDEPASGKKPLRLPVESLARQAAVGWCHLLLPVSPDLSPNEEEPPAATCSETADDATSVLMRIDIQNFGRCGADIVRAKIPFDTQLIKDVGDGPFRAGNYEHAFRTFEQLALGFTSAVNNSRRAIADGRRKLNAEKGKLSGKEIQERTAAFVRGEQLIHTAEREFSTILEGLRMYLRSRQDERKEQEGEQGE